MKCSDFERFVDAYLDNEFEEREAAEIELHIETCPDCRHLIDLQSHLRQAVRTTCNTCAPEHLKRNILMAIDEIDVEPLPSRSWRQWPGWRALTLAAAAAMLMTLGVAGLGFSGEADHTALSGNFHAAIASIQQNHGTVPEEVVQETLDWHRRSLPMEVTGPRTEDVNHWFNGKVDFPVHIPRFDDLNVALLGGRLANVKDQRAALLTLEFNQRKISMMVFPNTKQTTSYATGPRQVSPRTLIMQSAGGYNLAIIQDGDITYSVTSDLPRHELDALVHSAFFDQAH